jgi:hypothetical protein
MVWIGWWCELDDADSFTTLTIISIVSAHVNPKLEDIFYKISPSFMTKKPVDTCELPVPFEDYALLWRGSLCVLMKPWVILTGVISTGRSNHIKWSQHGLQCIDATLTQFSSVLPSWTRTRTYPFSQRNHMLNGIRRCGPWTHFATTFNIW